MNNAFCKLKHSIAWVLFYFFVSSVFWSTPSNADYTECSGQGVAYYVTHYRYQILHRHRTNDQPLNCYENSDVHIWMETNCLPNCTNNKKVVRGSTIQVLTLGGGGRKSHEILKSGEAVSPLLDLNRTHHGYKHKALAFEWTYSVSCRTSEYSDLVQCPYMSGFIRQWVCFLCNTIVLQHRAVRLGAEVGDARLLLYKHVRFLLLQLYSPNRLWRHEAW